MIERIFSKAVAAEGKGFEKAFNVTINANLAPAQKDKVVLESFYDHNNSTRVLVTANTGVAAAWGLHHYFKYNFGAHFSWTGSIMSKNLKSLLIPSYIYTVCGIKVD